MFNEIYLGNKFERIGIFSSLTGGGSIILASVTLGLEQYGMGFAFIFGGLLYALINNKLDNSYGRSTYNSRKLIVILLTIFCLLFSISLLSVIQTPYDRSLLHFISITSMYTVIAIGIIFLEKTKLISFLLLSMVIVTSVLYRAARFYNYSTIPGTDIHGHLIFANSIYEFGTITGDTRYVTTPLWHLKVAISELIVELNTFDLTFSIVVLSFILVTVLGMYLIGYSMGGETIGLFAALFTAISDMFILRGVTSITPSTAVISYSIIAIYLLIFRDIKGIKNILAILLIFAIVLTHQLSSFGFLVILVGSFLGKYLSPYIIIYLTNVREEKNNKSNLSFNIVVYLFASLFASWMSIKLDDMTFFDAMILRLVSGLQRLLGYTESSEPYSDSLSGSGFWENLLYNFGHNLLFLFAIVGFLYWASDKSINQVKIVCLSSLSLLFIIIYPGTALGLDLVFIPHRLLPFLFLFLILGAAYAFSTISMTRNRIQQVLVISMCIVLVFTMITTPYINRGDTFYADGSENRAEYTDSEIMAALWAVNHSSSTIYADPLFTANQLSSIYSDEMDMTTIDDYGQHQFETYSKIDDSNSGKIMTRSYYISNMKKSKYMCENNRKVYSNGRSEICDYP